MWFKHTCVIALLRSLRCGSTLQFHWCYCRLSPEYALLLCPQSWTFPPAPFFVLEIVVLDWCHTGRWKWAADRRWRSRTILLAAVSWYNEAAVMWNWFLSQNTCLWDYAPALAVRVLRAGRIWCSVKSDATSSPIWVFLNKLEVAVWLISVHIDVMFLKLC